MTAWLDISLASNGHQGDVSYYFNNHFQTKYEHFTELSGYLSRLPWIFLGTPLKVNEAPENIQGNLARCDSTKI